MHPRRTSQSLEQKVIVDAVDGNTVSGKKGPLDCRESRQELAPHPGYEDGRCIRREQVSETRKGEHIAEEETADKPLVPETPSGHLCWLTMSW
jgi:hypothetical protein